jgi:hypothetical protein
LIYPDARQICGEVLEFTTKAHRRHVCINGAPHTKEKHVCKCGVKWTKDPELAAKPEHGEKWSSEQIIYQGGRTEPLDSARQMLDPTKSYDSNDDKSGYN